MVKMEGSPSSSIITHRHSSLTPLTSLNTCSLEKWIYSANHKGDITEKLFRNITYDEFQEILAFLEEMGVKIRFNFSYDDEHSGLGELILKVPTRIHESVAGIFNGAQASFNSGISGNNMDPLLHYGSADITLNGRPSASPDASYEIIGRDIDHPSPNLVMEAHYHSNISVSRFVVKLQRYLRETMDILIAVGIVIYDRNSEGTIPMVCIVLQRQPGVPQQNQGASPSRIISFGTLALHHQAITALQHAFLDSEVIFEGVGFGGPPCNEANAAFYTLHFPGILLAAADNDGLVLSREVTRYGTTAETIQTFNVPLFQLQTHILLAMKYTTFV